MATPPIRQHSAKAYLVLSADVWNNGTVRGLNIKHLRKNKPFLEPDEIAVRVSITVPDSVFTQPPFETSIVVPEQEVIRPEVTIAEVPQE